MHRRRFLKQSGAGLGGLAGWTCSGSLAALAAARASAAGPDTASILAGCPFRFGFQSYSLRHFEDPETLAEQAAKLQLAFVEVYRGHLPTTAADLEISRFKRTLEQVRIKVNAFGVERFTADHQANQNIFEFASKLGVENLSADPSPEAFPSLEKLVRQYDIRIAIHNHGPEDERWRRPEWILEAVKNLDPRIGACVDTGHYLRADIDPIEAIRLLGPRVWGVHLKDFDSGSRERVIGEGRLDLAGTFQALLDAGFRGPLSLEYEDHREDPVPHMLEGLAAAAEALKGMF